MTGVSRLRKESWGWRGEESPKHETALGGELGACSEDLFSGNGVACSVLSWQERRKEKTPWQDEVML